MSYHALNIEVKYYINCYFVPAQPNGYHTIFHPIEQVDQITSKQQMENTHYKIPNNKLK